MKIFFSHSSYDKPLVREIKDGFPTHIKTWIDEADLLIGEPIKENLQYAIQAETDFVIVFLSKESIQSKWVRQEMHWALEQEKIQNRTIIIPVLLDKNIIQKIEPKQLQNRKYLECFSREKAYLEAFSNKLYIDLISLII